MHRLYLYLGVHADANCVVIDNNLYFSILVPYLVVLYHGTPFYLRYAVTSVQ